MTKDKLEIQRKFLPLAQGLRRERRSWPDQRTSYRQMAR